MPHLLAAISAHGYGHLAQSAPVLNVLHEQVPQLQLTVRCALPREVLARRITGPFTHQPVADDFGMEMHSALAVDTAASAARYRAWHENWDARVAGVARDLQQTAPDLILADVPYLTLAAAAQAGIPAVAMCCLNWADIYRHYCYHLPEGSRIHGQILAAYNSASLFLRSLPAMPMAELHPVHDIGPLAQVGLARRGELDARFGLDTGERLVLVAMGGIAFRPPLECWPQIEGLRYVVPRDWQVARRDTRVLEDSGLAFSDLLASCDAVITKPGYGTFVEAACAGVPLLYVPRDDWPEAPWLVRWLEQQLPCAVLPPEELAQGRFLPRLQSLWQQPLPVRCEPVGVAQAVVELRALLEGAHSS